MDSQPWHALTPGVRQEVLDQQLDGSPFRVRGDSRVRAQEFGDSGVKGVKPFTKGSRVQFDKRVA